MIGKVNSNINFNANLYINPYSQNKERLENIAKIYEENTPKSHDPKLEIFQEPNGRIGFFSDEIGRSGFIPAKSSKKIMAKSDKQAAEELIQLYQIFKKALMVQERFNKIITSLCTLLNIDDYIDGDEWYDGIYNLEQSKLDDVILDEFKRNPMLKNAQLND